MKCADGSRSGHAAFQPRGRGASCPRNLVHRPGRRGCTLWERDCRCGPSPIEYIPYDQAYEPGFEDMMRRVPSVEKLHALTGFRPRTSLNEIIDRVTAFFQQKAEALDAHKVATTSAN